LPSSPQLLPLTTPCTPDLSSPPPAPSSISSPSSAPEPPSPPHAAVEATSATASPAPSPQTPASTGPPTPPPWPPAYVFSTDPDRIVCRKCCNHHYNYRWYRHCCLCNRT
jgi:hypothetical protein